MSGPSSKASSWPGIAYELVQGKLVGPPQGSQTVMTFFQLAHADLACGTKSIASFRERHNRHCKTLNFSQCLLATSDVSFHHLNAFVMWHSIFKDFMAARSIGALKEPDLPARLHLLAS